jgi:hypothetical protein
MIREMFPIYVIWLVTLVNLYKNDLSKSGLNVMKVDTNYLQL